MRWSLPISIFLHALLVFGLFITQRHSSAPVHSAIGADANHRNRELIEFDIPATEPQTVSFPPKPPLEVIPPTVPPDAATAKKVARVVKAKPSPTPSFKLQQVEGAYQISISPSFTGANSAKPDVPPAKTERTATDE